MSNIIKFRSKNLKTLFPKTHVDSIENRLTVVRNTIDKINKVVEEIKKGNKHDLTRDT
jgi:RNA polymerase-interacting CarD/CdnL/TRCF family regulator